MIDWLDENQRPYFPPTAKALTEPDGLLAAGGGISPAWLYEAYRHGVFPWHDEDSPRLWWTPAPRAVILPDHFHVSRSIRKELKKTRLTFTANHAFERVMTLCASTHADEGGTWIQPEMIASYTAMAKAGMGLSVECWDEHGSLVGGFYGILIGRAYFGESMFSLVSGASKQAFAIAAGLLFDSGIEMIDCQMRTEHLARFGLVELQREDFEQRLAIATQLPPVSPLPSLLPNPWAAERAA
ncbi:leucyl/phenylalanyl-tRNA--protein transferase [Oceanobacter kriegii]|uniref:leucyl/phenylalanyl-tRNA--protein transferase n=1 Tax=Oceanobacter kriegii TaxID=64972 RepID=UPI0003F8D10C|nr:leucyl/phenylalanyl-tRNA--protein transferase [Oceanobacter kriegii]